MLWWLCWWVTHTRYIFEWSGTREVITPLSSFLWRTTTESIDPKQARRSSRLGFCLWRKRRAQHLNLISFFGLLWDQLERVLCKKCPTNRCNLWKLLQEMCHLNKVKAIGCEHCKQKIILETESVLVVTPYVAFPLYLMYYWWRKNLSNFQPWIVSDFSFLSLRLISVLITKSFMPEG